MAGRIRDEDIAAVRDRSPIAEIIGDHVSLRNAGGGNLKGLCPFHDERSPSLSVSPARGLFHCLGGQTQVITPHGLRRIADLAGTTTTVLTEPGRWIDAPFAEYGVQRLYDITLRRGDRTKTISATDGHRWFLRRSAPGGGRGVERRTTDLKPGDRLAAVFPTSEPVRSRLVIAPFGVARGITFGAGHRAGPGSFADLRRGKDVELLKWFPISDTFEQEDRITVTDLPAYFLDLPSIGENPAYLYGWLAGYFAADGCVAGNGHATLANADPANLEHVRSICHQLGIATSSIARHDRIGVDGPTAAMYQLELMTEDLTPEFFLLSSHRLRITESPQRNRHGNWVVVSVARSDRFEPVYCAEVPGTHSFVLEDNILTGNCFGCGAGGDVIRFVERIENLSFADAVEQLAAHANIQLRYVEGGAAPVRNRGERTRLIEAHAMAAQFYAEQLRTPAAQAAREFLAARGFDAAAAERFSCGYAPEDWDLLTKFLLGKGFAQTELVTGGLSKPTQRGSLIDRFHRRLLWPIRDVSGEVVGFGARRLYDDDRIEAKYLNTPETPIYKKSQLLYGMDHAKKEIARQHRAVIVEGYTDVMACHLAGVTTAVATCGTAFGNEHITVLRRLLMDSDAFRGEVIFTFDGDAAGMKAAERAFGDDQKFIAQTFIAVGPNGQDPCELRLSGGDVALRDLVAARIPLVEFVLRTAVDRFDLDTAEGVTAALDTGIPLVARIKDHSLRDEYSRRLAGLVGVDDPMRVVNRVRGLIRSGQRGEAAQPAAAKRPQIDPAVASVEREVLKVAMQFPGLAGPAFDALEPDLFIDPRHQRVRVAVGEVGGTPAAGSPAEWTSHIAASLPDDIRPLVSALAVDPLHTDNDDVARYADAVIARLQEIAVGRQVSALKSKLQRINPLEAAAEYGRLFTELVAAENHRRVLRERAIGGM